MRSCLEKYISLCIYALKKIQNQRGYNFETKIIMVVFFRPADQNERYHNPLLYEIWGSQNKVLHMEKRGEPAQANNSQWRHQQKDWRQYPASPTPTAETLSLNKISHISVDKNAITFIVWLCLNFKR